MKQFSVAVLAAMSEMVRADAFDIEATLLEAFANITPEGTEVIMFENERGRSALQIQVQPSIFCVRTILN